VLSGEGQYKRREIHASWFASCVDAGEFADGC
jgi:hypothetical protein